MVRLRRTHEPGGGHANCAEMPAFHPPFRHMPARPRRHHGDIDRSRAMMRSLWISKTGMEAQQTQLDTISNNLANVSTNGYKRAHAVFEDLMYQNLRQAGANSTEQTTLPTGLQVGLGTRAVATSRSC